MISQRRRRQILSGLLVLMIVIACDESASLLDFEGLRRYLKLTPSQTEVISGDIGRVISEVETYIRVARRVSQDLAQDQGRVDDRTALMRPEVETARQQAVRNIRQIADEIRKTLTPEQQKLFDRIVLPDLRESPQELEFMMVRSRQDTFSALRVKTVTHIRLSAPGDSQAVSYDALKEERTIVFGPGGFSSGLEEFPVFVTATLFDSVLVDAEIRRTAPPDSIDGEAGRARREAYYAEKQSHDMFTIQMILSTFLHESYTRLDRWAVYIEDDKDNQYEPASIMEDRGLIPPAPSPLIPRGYIAEGDVAMARKARQFELRFPYRDASGRQIIGPETHSLRLVLFDRTDPSYRTQGEWVLR